jgi:hypothetical protein
VRVLLFVSLTHGLSVSVTVEDQVQAVVLGIAAGVYVMVLSGLQRGDWPDYSYWLLVVTACAGSAAVARHAHSPPSAPTEAVSGGCACPKTDWV